MAHYTPIEKLEVTIRFERLADQIWNKVSTWPALAQNTVGVQLVNAADSVAANIIEGGYKESDPDALRFFGIARGSSGETSYWLRRAMSRNFMDVQEGEQILTEWTAAIQLLNNLINYRRSTRWKVREQRATYQTEPRSSELAEPESPGA